MNNKILKSLRRDAILVLTMVILTVSGLYFSVQLSKVSVPLLSADKSFYPWLALPNTDQKIGGTSELLVNDVTSTLDFDFMLPAEPAHPWIALTLAFDDFDDPKAYVDWTRYKTLSLIMKCTPSNVLSFAFYLYEDELTQAGDFSTFRNAGIFAKCYEGRQKVTIDLRSLVTPGWWLMEHDLHLSHQKYRLDKVVGLAIHNSLQSPRQISSNVTIYSATLEGGDWQYFYLACFLTVAIWAGILYRVLRKRNQKLIAAIIERVKEDAKKEQAFTPYQQLPEVTRHDLSRNENAVLSYIAKEYSNAELNIEAVASVTTLNRAKINAILKGKYGVTFSVYLNKLRLAEAARLLESDGASIADVADAVGYGSPSYFITTFKKEYGCTPSSFKKHNAHKMTVEDKTFSGS